MGGWTSLIGRRSVACGRDGLAGFRGSVRANCLRRVLCDGGCCLPFGLCGRWNDAFLTRGGCDDFSASTCGLWGLLGGCGSARRSDGCCCYTANNSDRRAFPYRRLSGVGLWSVGDGVLHGFGNGHWALSRHVHRDGHGIGRCQRQSHVLVRLGRSGISLNGVACGSVSMCVAVGTQDASGDGGGGASWVVERWNGRSWRVVEAPRPSHESGTGLASVSCSSATACTAVGVVARGDGPSSSLVKRLSGTRWTTQKGLGPAEVDGVSCPSTDSCTAVGVRNDNVDFSRDRGLAARWDGRHWLREPIPHLKHRTELDSVSCPTARRCVAVGDSPPPALTEASKQTPVSATFNGSRWVARRTPFPSGWHASLDGVSCASPADCTAVGEIFTLSPQKRRILIERWNGQEWTIQHTT